MSATPPASRTTLEAMRATPPGTVITVAGNDRIACTYDGGMRLEERGQVPLCLAYANETRIAYAGCSSAIMRLNFATNTVTMIPTGHGIVTAVALMADRSALLFVQSEVLMRLSLEDETITLLAGELGVPGYCDGLGEAARFFHNMGGICITRRGQFGFIADTGNNAIRRAALHGAEPADVGTLHGPMRYDTDTGPIIAEEVGSPSALALSLDETVLFVGEWNRVLAIDLASRAVRTVAGSDANVFDDREFADGPGNAARFSRVTGLVVGPNGALFCADVYNGRIRAINVSAEVSTLAGTGRRIASEAASRKEPCRL